MAPVDYMLAPDHYNGATDYQRWLLTVPSVKWDAVFTAFKSNLCVTSTLYLPNCYMVT